MLGQVVMELRGGEGEREDKRKNLGNSRKIGLSSSVFQWRYAPPPPFPLPFPNNNLALTQLARPRTPPHPIHELNGWRRFMEPMRQLTPFFLSKLYYRNELYLPSAAILDSMNPDPREEIVPVIRTNTE